MSYHVHGYKIDDLSIVDLHKKLKNIQTKARKIGENFFHKAIMKKVCESLDFHKVSLEMRAGYTPDLEKLRLPLSVACKEVEKEISNLKNGTRSPLISMELEVCVYPLSESSFILSVYTEREEYESLFVEAGFSPYNYQNSTDKPDEVSSREWKQREKNWDYLLTKGSPSENGFSFQIVKQLETFFIKDEVLMENIPSKEERAKTVFGSVSFDLKKRIENDSTPIEWKDFMDHIWWMQDTEEGKKFKEDHIALILKIIPETYPLIDVLGFERKNR